MSIEILHQRPPSTQPVYPSSLVDRFWRHVDRTASDGCWPWNGATIGKGYGWFAVSSAKREYAHRVAYQLSAGVTLRPGECVCHHCDNPICVNPAHLFVGSHADNVRDRDLKGRRRAPRGEFSAAAKLTGVHVTEIRTALSSGSSQSDLARKYGVRRSCINSIAAGRTWRVS